MGDCNGRVYINHPHDHYTDLTWAIRCLGSWVTLNDMGKWFRWFMKKLKSLAPCDVRWGHRTWSTLVHYLNQCRLILSEILRYSPESNLKEMLQISIIKYVTNYTFKVTAISPRIQWVNTTTRNQGKIKLCAYLINMLYIIVFLRIFYLSFVLSCQVIIYKYHHQTLPCHCPGIIKI